MKNRVEVYAMGGKQLLRLASGEIIPGLIFTRVHDEAGKSPYVIAKLHVQIKNTDEIPGSREPLTKIRMKSPPYVFTDLISQENWDKMSDENQDLLCEAAILIFDL